MSAGPTHTPSASSCSLVRVRERDSSVSSPAHLSSPSVGVDATWDSGCS